MFDKKGEKSLQMIFGLFILLIISLVVLSLFFKFTERSSATLTGTEEEFFSRQQLEKAETDCEVKCKKIVNVDDALEFCRKAQRIDFDADKEASALTKADKGRWQFCEDRIPCFILYSCYIEPITYDGTKCKTLLEQYRQDYLAALLYPSNTGTCELDVTGDPATSHNWVERYDYVS